MKVGINNRANLGRVGNKLQKRYSYMSAQKAKTKKQNRISVRGVAMNPVDHPNGGRSNTKQPLKNP
jgi:large subunit ribosomal protein L2